ncbi:MAG: hypothetical protein IAE91_00135, partial [Ignavibacteriaceae bacterium]|nr:hypothetical protein [Ignavibacteriaceae bacterium]
VQGKNKLEDDQIKNVPELNMYLFSVRYKIEIEIRKIWENSIGNHNLKKKTPLFQMLRELFANDYIDINLYEPHKEILAITSLGIHGEKISDIQSSFVKDIAPRLIATLEEKK